VETETNGFELWKLIYKLHTVGDDLEDDIFKMDRCEHNFWEARMSPEESLINYYNRFQILVDAFTTLQQQQPGPKMQAYQFIKSLDETRFSEFKRTIENQGRMGGSFPDSLPDALAKANTFIPTISRHHNDFNMNPAVFNFSSNRRHGQQSSNSVTCWTCGKQGHVSSECRSRRSNVNHRHNQVNHISPRPTGQSQNYRQSRQPEQPVRNGGPQHSRSIQKRPQQRSHVRIARVDDEELIGEHVFMIRQYRKDQENVILDNGAEISIFSNSSLLTDIQGSR
jgi:hypothetical protein